MKSNRIKGITILDKMNELNSSLVEEAEVNAVYLPPLSAAEKYEQKKARRDARRIRREDNPFLRFAGSGLGAVCISLIVAFVLVGGIVYGTGHLNRTPSAGEPNIPAGDSLGNERETALETIGDGSVSVGTVDAAYRVYTDQVIYQSVPTSITLSAHAKHPGEKIGVFHTANIECLTHPDRVVQAMWTEEGMVESEIDADEYAHWSKRILIDGDLPAGVYRIHHMQYNADKQGYVSAAYCDFAVGKTYGALLVANNIPPFTTRADQDSALLDEFFKACEGAEEIEQLLAGNHVTRENLYHITPDGLYEATGVRIFKSSDYCASFFLMNGKVYPAGSFFGGYGIHNAVVCDYDLNGVDDILFTCSWGSGVHRSEVWVFNTESAESILITDTFTTEGSAGADLDLCVFYPDSEKLPGLSRGPIITLFAVTRSLGEHHFADMGFVPTRLYGMITLHAGALPTVERWEDEISEETRPSESTPMETDPWDTVVEETSGTSDPLTPPSPDSYPEAKEKPYTITATMELKGTVGRLRVTYRATEPGAILSPNATIRLQKIDGTLDAEEPIVLWTEEYIEAMPPSETEYAQYTRTGTIRNPEAMRPGTYRVYALNYQFEEGYTCVATTEVRWEYGEEETVPVPAEGINYHIKSASIEKRDSSAEIAITYIANEPGVTLYYPETAFRMTKIAGDPNPTELIIVTHDIGYESIAPSGANGGYAVFTVTHYVDNPDALLAGTYRIDALTWAGALIDTVDVIFDGTISKNPPISYTPFTISVPEVVAYNSPMLEVTFRATEPGRSVTSVGTPILEKIDGMEDIAVAGLSYPDLIHTYMPESPDAYAEGTTSYLFVKPALMREGTYRISIIVNDEVVASDTFEWKVGDTLTSPSTIPLSTAYDGGALTVSSHIFREGAFDGFNLTYDLDPSLHGKEVRFHVERMETNDAATEILAPYEALDLDTDSFVLDGTDASLANATERARAIVWALDPIPTYTYRIHLTILEDGEWKSVGSCSFRIFGYCDGSSAEG